VKAFRFIRPQRPHTFQSNINNDDDDDDTFISSSLTQSYVRRPSFLEKMIPIWTTWPMHSNLLIYIANKFKGERNSSVPLEANAQVKEIISCCKGGKNPNDNYRHRRSYGRVIFKFTEIDSKCYIRSNLSNKH